MIWLQVGVYLELEISFKKTTFEANALSHSTIISMISNTSEEKM